MDLGLNNKTAVVYGASRGLGRAIAESLIAEGAKVLLVSRNEDELKTVSQKIGAFSYIAGDLSQEGQAQKICNEALNRMGSIDILVTNTGGPSAGEFLQISQEQWRKDFQSLWMSVVESLHVVLPEMQKKGFGRVIMLTSLAAKEPMARLTTSNGLRAGLDGLCKSITNEYAAYGITVNVVRPGYIDTDRMRQIKIDDEFVAKIAAAKRIGRPEEIGDFVSFLASEKAAYITGQSINVDGGAGRSHS